MAVVRSDVGVANGERFADWLDDDALSFGLAVERRSGQWYALLMDFDITGTGETLREAIQNALDAMTTYLAAYFEDGEPFAAALRPIPRRLRARIAVETIVGRLARQIRGARRLEIASDNTYTLPPAVLAGCISE